MYRVPLPTLRLQFQLWPWNFEFHSSIPLFTPRRKGSRIQVLYVGIFNLKVQFDNDFSNANPITYDDIRYVALIWLHYAIKMKDEFVLASSQTGSNVIYIHNAVKSIHRSISDLRDHEIFKDAAAIVCEKSEKSRKCYVST